MKKLIGYPKMLEEAKQSKRKGHVWIVELLIFVLVFFVASTAESIPLTIASTIGYFSENIPQLMEILQTEGFFAYYMEIVSGLTEYLLSSSWMELLSLFSTAAATVIVILYCTKIEKRSLASMGFRKHNFFLEYLYGAIAGIVSISIAAVAGILSGAYSFSFAEPKIWWLLLFLLGFILQGMSEEVMCRGYLMNSMSRKTPVLVCVLLTSLMFALMHFANPGFGWLPFINLLLSGISFAVFMLKRGNIWGACAMHTFWNFYQGPIFGISVSGTGCTEHSVFTAAVSSAENMGIWTGGDFGIEGGLCVTIAEVLTLLFVLFVLPKSKEEQFVPVSAAGPAPSAGAAFGVNASAFAAAPQETAQYRPAESVPAAVETPVAVQMPAAEAPVKTEMPVAETPAKPEMPAAEAPAAAFPNAVYIDPASAPAASPNVTVLDFNTPRVSEPAGEPVVQKPVTSEPVIRESIIEEPVVEEPVIEEPVIEEPVIEEPVIEEPVIEETIVMDRDPSQNI